MLDKIILLLLVLFNLLLQANSTDSSSVVRINNITITGNKVTKEHIVVRELVFSINDTLTKFELEAAIKSSKENLLNTSLFNFATFSQTYFDSSSVDINIELIERWYIWPFPLFELAETNFNTWWLTKDFSRTNYGFYVVKENFRGRRETLKVRARFGYAEQFALQYSVPYINNKQTHGIGVTVGLSRKHEVTYKTVNNKRLFYKNNDAYAIEGYYGRIAYVHRKRIHNSNTFQLDYENTSVDDSLISITDDFFNRKKATSIEYFTLTWYFKQDKRDNNSYPLKGHFFDFELDKVGLGMAKNEKIDLLINYMSFKKYWQLSQRFYLAGGLIAKFTFLNNPPYYLQTGLGYGNNVVRGYDYYVIDGQHFGLLKANLKFELVKPTIGKIKFLPIEQFNTFHYAIYLNLFADAGYVSDNLYAKDNSLSNAWLFGSGLGLDYVTYYDVVLRFEYAINKMGEHGFFFNYIKAI